MNKPIEDRVSVAQNAIKTRKDALAITERDIRRYKSLGMIAKRIAAEKRAVRLRNEIREAEATLDRIRNGGAVHCRQIRVAY